MKPIVFLDKNRITRVEVRDKELNSRINWRDEKVSFFGLCKKEAGFFDSGIYGEFSRLYQKEELTEYIVEDKLVYYKPYVRISTIDSGACPTFITFDEALAYARSIVDEEFIEIPSR